MKVSEIEADQAGQADQAGIKLAIKDTSIGKGLFATVAIPKGTSLGFYSGQLRKMSPDLVGNDKLLKLREKPPWYPRDVDFSVYNIVDATTDKNNFLKFINDYRGLADAPNVRYLANGMFYTDADIAENEQLLTDYGARWWDTYRQNARERALEQFLKDAKVLMREFFRDEKSEPCQTIGWTSPDSSITLKMVLDKRATS